MSSHDTKKVQIFSVTAILAIIGIIIFLFARSGGDKKGPTNIEGGAGGESDSNKLRKFLSGKESFSKKLSGLINKLRESKKFYET